MKLDFTTNNNTLTVSIEGRLDTISAPELESFLNDKTEGMEALTLECKNLEYVSSAGLRVLLSAHKKMEGAMKLKNVGELVMEVFEMTGFADVLVIE